MKKYRCIACKKLLPLTEFYKEKSKRGHIGKCRKCVYLYAKNWRAQQKPLKPKNRYLIYASYDLDGREHLVDWLIPAPFITTAMNIAMHRMGELGGDHRHIDEMIEMTPEFIERQREMDGHREGDLYEFRIYGRRYQQSRRPYYRQTENYSRVFAGHLELQS